MLWILRITLNIGLQWAIASIKRGDLRQKDKQWLQNTTHKTKDWVTRTPVKNGGELKTYNQSISPNEKEHIWNYILGYNWLILYVEGVTIGSFHGS
jgi:hypothetical protein